MQTVQGGVSHATWKSRDGGGVAPGLAGAGLSLAVINDVHLRDVRGKHGDLCTLPAQVNKQSGRGNRTHTHAHTHVHTHTHAHTHTGTCAIYKLSVEQPV